jgi:membrane protein required for colicin V production
VNWLDIVLVLILSLSVFGGLVNGFAKVGIGLIATVLGLFCGLWFYGTAGSFLLPYVSHKGIANFIGFVLVFFGILLMGALASKLIGLLFRWTGLTWLDRLLGGAFGVLRGVVIGVALVLALMAFSPEPPPRSVVESHVAPYVIDAANICTGFAPREVKDGVRTSYERIKQAWSEVLKKRAKSFHDQEI